jgi:hypothetical protein
MRVGARWRPSRPLAVVVCCFLVGLVWCGFHAAGWSLPLAALRPTVPIALACTALTALAAAAAGGPSPPARPAHPVRPATAAVRSSSSPSDDVTAALADADLHPDHLTIEVTETAALDDNVALRALTTLRRRGIRIALDDFGTSASPAR